MHGRRLPWPRRAVVRRSAAGVAVAALVLGAAVAVWGALAAALAGAGGSQVRLLADGQDIAARALVGPRDALFGDPIEAHVRVAVDPGRVEVRSLALHTRMAPYRIVGRTRSERRIGHDVLVDEKLRLQCVGVSCLPFGGRRPFTLPPARVSYRLRGGNRRERKVSWPVLALGSRLALSDVQHAAFRLSTPVRPAPPTRLGLGLLEALAFIGAGLAALAGSGLLVLALVPERVSVALASAPATAPERPLEVALARVRELAGRRRPGIDGSWALEALADALDDAGLSELSARARSLAWSPETIPVGALTSLVEDCEAAARAAAPSQAAETEA